jgi:hypothetical protein
MKMHMRKHPVTSSGLSHTFCNRFMSDVMNGKKRVTSDRKKVRCSQCKKKF